MSKNNKYKKKFDVWLLCSFVATVILLLCSVILQTYIQLEEVNKEKISIENRYVSLFNQYTKVPIDILLIQKELDIYEIKDNETCLDATTYFTKIMIDHNINTKIQCEKNDIGNHVLLKTYIYIDPYTKNIYLDTTNKSFEDCIEIFCLQNYGKLYDYYLNNSEIIEIEIDNPDVYTTYYQYETIK